MKGLDSRKVPTRTRADATSPCAGATTAAALTVPVLQVILGQRMVLMRIRPTKSPRPGTGRAAQVTASVIADENEAVAHLGAMVGDGRDVNLAKPSTSGGRHQKFRNGHATCRSLPSSATAQRSVVVRKRREDP